MIETDKCQFLYNLKNNMLNKKKTKEIYIMTTIRSKTNKNVTMK